VAFLADQEPVQRWLAVGGKLGHAAEPAAARATGLPGMKVTGLDGSLTAYGLARIVSTVPGMAGIRRDTCKPKFTGPGATHKRLDRLTGTVLSWCTGSDLVVLEGLAFGAKGSAVTDLAGLHWVVRQALWQHEIRYVIVPPPVRAKWLTGNGRAGKDECLAAAIKRFPNADIADNNQADAVTLAAMALARYDLPLAKMPASSYEQLGKIAWPDMKGTD
jgi:crossover junction endodeoxyribonuclease RuvC